MSVDYFITLEASIKNDLKEKGRDGEIVYDGFYKERLCLLVPLVAIALIIRNPNVLVSDAIKTTSSVVDSEVLDSAMRGLISTASFI